MQLSGGNTVFSFPLCLTGVNNIGYLLAFSLIGQVILEMRALWLVEDCVIFCYNHLARGDYNT